ncbi:homoserine kinase [Halalkalibacter akibai]|uniref:Homoserine kinase n=1 Tax=Halalkalibacter akibai (strain ATCC 43226 / DSM 21942 / CIP 109018 / JCM 9157 / 1139) TaxID=1236973 RepID=W4QPK7_HALA3|nr:homoserine kinase [Halalkalibacter akibai]GAE33279.1 homoserine kinase [Halalkalibacter akibai JCM 9157]
MSLEPFQITVPGSSANLGPGFDSVGLAVNRYLTLEVRASNEWLFHSNSVDLQGIETGEDNLIYQVAAHVASARGEELPPCHVEMTSDIPLARGLGSSAAAIVAGIELANQLMGEPLSVEEKVRFASLWEGHPDNVAASVYGGLVIGTHTESATDVLYGGIPEIDLVLLVPSEELKTKKARGVLPEQLGYREAVRASSVANVLVASLLQGNWEKAGKMMNEDLFHHPYRRELVPHLEEVIRVVQEETTAYGAALSGAGPTMLCLAPAKRGEEIQEKLQRHFPAFEVLVLRPAKEGIQVKKGVSQKQTN